MRRLPDVADEARVGRLSPEHLRAVSDCAHRHPDLAVEHEDGFVAQAAMLGAEGLRVAVRHWLAAADGLSGGEPAAKAGDVSHLHASRSFGGWLRIDGHFAPDDADVVEAALGAGVDLYAKPFVLEVDVAIDGVRQTVRSPEFVREHEHMIAT